MKIVQPLVLIASLFLTSCITRYAIKDHKSYDETFFSYYTSQYNDDLVFIGKEFHYVFKDTEMNIAEFTKPQWKEKMSVRNIDLSVNKDNKVYGSAVLEVIVPIKDIKKEEVSLLEKYGFKEDRYRVLTKKIDLNGIRYLPNSIKYDNNHFRNPYKVKIKYELNTGEKVKKVLITPIAMTADGMIILSGGVVIPLVIIALTHK